MAISLDENSRSLLFNKIYILNNISHHSLLHQQQIKNEVGKTIQQTYKYTRNNDELFNKLIMNSSSLKTLEIITQSLKKYKFKKMNKGINMYTKIMLIIHKSPQK